MSIANSQRHLLVLRDRLRSRTMSVLVGAGFSKNVSAIHFPSWDELLRKLVLSFRTSDLLDKYRGLKMDNSIEYIDPEFIKFLEREVASYITNNGYLQVVSDYIKVMGIRESIDSFIEENTPTAIKSENRDYLQFVTANKKEFIELEPSSLDLHRRLVNFPWNNVYTTNYDNLLEYCVDTQIGDKIDAKIKEIEKDHSKLLAEYEELKLKLEQPEDQPSFDNANILNPNPLTNTAPLPNTLENHEKNIRERANSQRKLERLAAEIEDLSNSQSQYRRSLEDCYAVISHSSKLSLKKHRNIIKLHGTIDFSDKSSSFDDDLHKRYVISKEDYENYPSKHEAFTQLMRISLLQDYFMLIGFSGDDPNFLAWVSWVRDVIQRGKDPDKVGKIFLVDVSGDGNIPRYKQQFYHNHQIVHIPLSNPQTLSFLSDRRGSEIPSGNRREILSAFLDFLGEHAPYNPSQIAVEKLYRADYEGSFRTLPIYFDKDTTIDLTGLLKNKSIIKETSRYNRITSIHSTVTHFKTLYIDSFDEIIALYPDHLDDLLEVVIICLVDIHIPFRSLINYHPTLKAKIEERLNDYENCSSQLQWLQVYNALWNDELEILKYWLDRSSNLSMDVKNQMLCLGTLFEFKFTDTIEILRYWDASDHWSVVKAGLESHADTDAAKKRLVDANVGLVQEQLLGIELQLALAGFDGEQRLRELYDQMEFDGLKHVFGMIDALLRDVRTGTERIETRGNNKFAAGDGLHISTGSKDRSSLQIFGLLMESGFPLSTAKTSFYGHRAMFPAILASIPFYPIPVLFFAIQYDESSFLKRLGQEYAYEVKVDYYHERILRSLSDAYASKDTPARIRENSLLFLCEFIAVADSSHWERLFIIVWNEFVSTVSGSTDLRTPRMQFIAKALPIVQNLNVGNQVLADCLSMINAGAISAITSCSYYFRLNPFFTDQAQLIRRNLNDKLFSKLINSKQKNSEYLLAIGNLSVFLNIKDKKLVIDYIKKIEFGSISPTHLEVILSLLNASDVALREKLVRSLVRNPALWRTGLSDSRPGIFGPAPFIKLSVLKKQPAWITLETSEIKLMYNGLAEEVRKISEFAAKNPIGGMVDFRPVLQEMLWFLDDVVDDLNGEPNLNSVRKLIDELFLMHMAEASDIEVLLSNDLVNINWVIFRISRGIIDYHKISEHDEKIRQIITRISMKNPVGLESCFFYLVRWFYDLRNTNALKPYLKLGLRLLGQYQSNNYPASSEVSLIEEKLVQLAYVFRLWGDSSNLVNQFCEKLNSSRYISVRFALERRLRNDGMIT